MFHIPRSQEREASQSETTGKLRDTSHRFGLAQAEAAVLAEVTHEAGDRRIFNMAAPGKKKLVQQEELRRLMKAKQRESSAKKRIESPLAKYPLAGFMGLGKVAALKGTTPNTSSSSVTAQLTQPSKRKGPNPEREDFKRVKDSEEQSPAASTKLPAGFFETEQSSSKPINVKVPGLKLLTGEYDDDDDDGGKEENDVPLSVQKPTEIPLPPPTTSTDSLPADFFDSKTPVLSHSGSILKADIQAKTLERKENTAEALPEGFFDDPEVDAKVRKVDAPKDQMDKEWEEFQKEMRQVNTVSEAIVAEEDEEGRLDRQIDEIDEQIECYRRIEHLRKRKDVIKDVMNTNASKNKGMGEVGSDDEEMLSTILAQDWREKGTFL
ncbi:zinc finger 830 [Pelobates cultripes]|uniref:Zinc finger 830 n=1 Tax=Pelobates cultripes TaxID=61616 RepID=A0AAD1RYU6_PELCU|nr:zinc finger 830 [Pelobates cultripes]